MFFYVQILQSEVALKQRITTALIMIVVVTLALLNQITWTFLVCLAFMIAAKELGLILQRMELKASPFFMIFVVPGFVLSSAFMPLPFAIIVGVITVLVLFVIGGVILQRDHPGGLFVSLLIASVYPALLASLLVRIRFADTAFLVFLLLVVSVGDVTALYTGKYFGKIGLAHKIPERIGKVTSPNKTLEGFTAGILLGGLMVPAIFYYFRIVGGSAARILLVGLAISVVGIGGDLFESFLKRKAGVKDSGTILPGHGGMLDRFDALLFAVVVAAIV